MEKEQILSSGLLEMYVLGVASPTECTEVERLRSLYPEVQAEILSIEKGMEMYAFANAVNPSSQVKNNIFAVINNNASSNQSNNYNPTQKTDTAKVLSMPAKYKFAAAAAAILIVTSSVFNYVYYNKYSNINEKYAEGQSQIVSLNERLSGLDKDMGVVRSKFTEPVTLKGLEAAPDAAAKIFWMRNTGEVFVDAQNLPIAPKGMQYQLWGIVDGKPVSGGMITSKDGKTYSIQKMKVFGKAEAFAITLETEGGNEQPKGTMYVLGKI